MTSSSPEHAAPTPLDGVVVADTTQSVAGQYAGRLLAMHGATVVLVEPPEGTATRRMAPRQPDGPDSYLFRHLNQGKASVVVDRSSPDHADLLRDLLDRADVLLRDQGSAGAPGDRLVDCEIGDFPPGPYERWRGTEMVHQALGGAMNATGSAGRPPLYGIGHRAAYATGTTAYITVVAALYERRRSGRGQRVRATVFESLAAMGQNLVSQYSYNGTAENRARYPGFLAVLRCADAWVVLFAIRNWPGLCRAFGLAGLADDPRFATAADRMANWPAAVDLLQERARAMRADDVVAGCQAGRVSAEKVSSLADLVGSPHWQARSVLRRVPSAGGSREETALHRIAAFSGAAAGITAGSPDPGADTDRIAALVVREPR
ncbi:MAG TPA: CoA transferase [Streptosporangiaceae bacterium]|jgi:crotonobetainyl-CoA:carnitine CoA-transferase CaiB-like acyl-CoA transferase